MNRAPTYTSADSIPSEPSSVPGDSGQPVPFFSPWMRPKKAAAYLGVSVPYLEALRVHDKKHGTTAGPSFRKRGKIVVYFRPDLDAWQTQAPVGAGRIAKTEGGAA